MDIRARVKTLMAVGLLAAAGCSFYIDSVGWVCIPFCISLNDQRVPQEVQEEDKQDIRQIKFEVDFDRSILTSVDSFFSRYNENKEDKTIKRSLQSLAKVGLNHVEAMFGTSPEIIFVPDPGETSVGAKWNYSRWTSCTESPKAFQTIRPVIGKVGPSQYRWRLAALPLFTYDNSIENRVTVVVTLGLQIEELKPASNKFEKIAITNEVEYNRVIEDLKKRLLVSYKDYLKETYDLNVT